MSATVKTTEPITVVALSSCTVSPASAPEVDKPMRNTGFCSLVMLSVPNKPVSLASSMSGVASAVGARVSMRMSLALTRLVAAGKVKSTALPAVSRAVGVVPPMTRPVTFRSATLVSPVATV